MISIDVSIPWTGGLQFIEGDVLLCNADGYPEPCYKWIDGNGDTVSNTTRLTLTPGQFSLTCIAYGNITTPCSANYTISGHVIGKSAVYIPYRVHQ